MLQEIICGDCAEILPSLGEEIVSLTVTSPPYNVDIPYDNHSDHMPYKEYLDWMKNIWEEVFKITKDGGRLALNIAPTGISPFVPVHHDLVSVCSSVGWTLRAELLWYKQNMGKRTAWGSWMSPSCPHVIPSWEYIYIFHKGSPKLSGSTDPDITREEFLAWSDAFWEIHPETNKRGHPVPFPEELVHRLVKYYTFPGDIVLDPFGGSGTTAKVAKDLGRGYISIDISKEYTQLSRRRVDGF